ncbi:uncharacterized protein [Glycine max]|uniref:uncharacterized protein n=1 Tax=Glycine max TaxID=3847 RepID=UPI001B35474E|nr:uncharacterized protein LOC121174083 [Glycine max]
MQAINNVQLTEGDTDKWRWKGTTKNNTFHDVHLRLWRRRTRPHLRNSFFIFTLVMEFIQSRVEPWIKDQRAQLLGLKEKVSDEVAVGVAPRAQEADPRRVPMPPEPLPRPQGGILLRFAGSSLLYDALQVPIQGHVRR